jgi:hypothetical protein
MDYPVKSFRQFLAENVTAVGQAGGAGDSLADDSQMAGGVGSSDPYNQFAYFQNTGDPLNNDPRNYASAVARAEALRRRRGESITRGALERSMRNLQRLGLAHDPDNPTEASSAYNRLASARHWNQTPDNWLSHMYAGTDNDPARRADFDHTLGRMTRAYSGPRPELTANAPLANKLRNRRPRTTQG